MSRQQLTRRQFLITAGGAGAGLVLAGCRQKAPPLVRPSGRAVEAADERRRSSGAALREFDLKAGSADFDLAGRRGSTWGYGGSLPGPEIRVKAGDRVRIRFRNDLPAPTTIHWHGIRVRNDMDGVPKVTQSEVEPGTEFVYKFTVPDPGTFFFHPHMGFQLDRGLYAPFIVEDPSEAGDYDQDITVILDDWTDGVGKSPEQAFSDLRSASGGMPGMQHGGGMERMKPKKEDIEGPLRGDPGDVEYPFYLLNGRPKGDPAVLRAEPRQRLRIRVINAASDTAFRLALGGHRLTVTHTDGFPVDPVTVDALVIGMGERYDLLTTVQDTGAFPLVALAEGKGKHARAILRVGGPGNFGVENVMPAELGGQLLKLGGLSAAEGVRISKKKPDRAHRVVLGGDMEKFVWTINGETFEDSVPLTIKEGERVRLIFENKNPMFHPMHVHGHTFQVQHGGRAGPRKDTVIVLPKERIVVDFDADNPGLWMLHCHNLYHQEGGMMTTLGYLS